MADMLWPACGPVPAISGDHPSGNTPFHISVSPTDTGLIVKSIDVRSWHILHNQWVEFTICVHKVLVLLGHNS